MTATTTQPPRHRRVRAFLVAIGMLAAALVAPPALDTAFGTAPQAEAATSHTGTVIAPRWWGWCNHRSGGPNKLTVRHASGSQLYSNFGGDWVDVGLQSGWNHLQVTANCGYRDDRTVYVWVRSDRNGQRHYIGYPSGSWSN